MIFLIVFLTLAVLMGFGYLAACAAAGKFINFIDWLLLK